MRCMPPRSLPSGSPTAGNLTLCLTLTLTLTSPTGFVVGAVLQAVLNIADLVRPQVLYFGGCVGAAGWNALVAAPVNFP